MVNMRVRDDARADLLTRRFLREDQPDARAIDARLAVGRVVDLEDQRRSGGDALRGPGQIDRRILTDGPVHQHCIATAGRR